MGKPTGFLEIERELAPKRPPRERVRDWNEYVGELPDEHKRAQAARCMNCGIPFCNQGCPLGNLIPDWNDLVYRDHWREAIDALHRTNNFPEFTGRICPAPCESACVLGISEPPVTIKQIEVSIIDRAFKEGWVVPEPPRKRTGKKAAVIGSGPAGLAAAAQLNKAGHLVTVFERHQRPGGLLTFGIPDFKLEKHVVDRRIRLMEQEGVIFKMNADIGTNISAEDLKREFDAIVLAIGAMQPRDFNIPGRELDGIMLAMDYLRAQNEVVYGDLQPGRRHVTAKDKNVVIIGGGLTGADCLGTALRQGAKEVYQFELLPQPPKERAEENPWPEWPMILRTEPAHEEGGKRDWSVNTRAFHGEDGKVKKMEAVRLEWYRDDNGRMNYKEMEGTEFTLDADLVLLAMGFVHPEKKGPVEQLGVELDPRGNVKVDENYATSVEGVFAAGDVKRGASIVVWAIAEGRKAARGADLYLMGSSDLPA